MRRWWVLALVLVAAVAGTWVLATQVQSPRQAAAQAEAPAPIPVTAAVQRGYLHAPVTLSVTAQFQQLASVTAPDTLAGVVTATQVEAGEVVSAGSVLMRVNGRPLLVLPGAFPLYRDILPGDTGDDVVAVQAGLRAAGLRTGRDRDGVYGAGTQAAVRRLYRASGYDAPAGSTTGAGAVAPSADASAGADAAGLAPAPVDQGPRVLRSEVVMLASLPATVRSVAAPGAAVSGGAEVAALGSGDVLLSATLPATSVAGLVTGATATFAAPDGTTASAQVEQMAPVGDGTQVQVTVTASVPVDAGATVVLEIANPALEPADTLLVPISAVVSRGGRSFVYLEQPDEFAEVEVRVTDAVGGLAAVTALDDGAGLDESARVRIRD